MLREGLGGFCDALLSSSRLVLFGIDVQGRLRTVSAGWESMTAYPAEEILERPVVELIREDVDWEAFLRKLQTQAEATAAFTFLSKDGQTVRCEITAMPWLDEEDGLLGYVLYGRDLTAWEKFQDDLIRIDRLAEMGRMSAGIVHDLKNPLSIINQASGWAGVVVNDAKGLGEEDRNELSHTLKEIEEQTSRCRRITNQILEFVRESKPEKTAFDLKDLIRETVRYLQPELNYPPIEVVSGFDESAPLRVETDYKLLQQVCVNLLSNAIYAIREKTEDKGRIELHIESRADRILVSVQDNGPGIPHEVQERIFDLFYTTKPAGKGTGLGLPICRNIMRRLGGELTFQSQVSQGTTFTLSIPHFQEQ